MAFQLHVVYYYVFHVKGTGTAKPTSCKFF